VKLSISSFYEHRGWLISFRGACSMRLCFKHRKHRGKQSTGDGRFGLVRMQITKMLTDTRIYDGQKSSPSEQLLTEVLECVGLKLDMLTL